MLARFLTTKPYLKSKMKIIISSTTLNQSVPKRFQKIPNVNFAQFEVSEIKHPYPVQKIARPK